jgi:hypothetical protein
MNMRTTFTVILISSTMAGCGLKTYSSGVLRMGRDTFSVSADDLNPSTAKQAALTQAQNHCRTMGREILVTNTNPVRRNISLPLERRSRTNSSDVRDTSRRPNRGQTEVTWLSSAHVARLT